MHAKATETYPVEPYLVGLKFPAEKDDVLQVALRNHAPKEVLDLLEHLVRQKFVVPQDISEAYDAISRLHKT